MRYLGVDFGSKRIGLAVNGPGGVVSPLKMLPARPTVEENAREILKVAAEYDVDAIVVGLPLNMDDTEGPQAKLSRKLAEAIERIFASPTSRGGGPPGEGAGGPPGEAIESLASAPPSLQGGAKGGLGSSSPRKKGSTGGLKVYLHDERLTSHAADRRLVERELTRKQKRARQDAVAAQILLESFLQMHPEMGEGQT